MPITPSYPGVYIEELKSGVRTITGVSTSITAFIGYTRKGVVDTAVMVLSFSEFERRFGGLAKDSPLSYAVQQFFMNGGTQALVVRIAKSGTTKEAKVTLGKIAGGAAPVLVLTALEPGAWANGLQVAVDYETAFPESTFNFKVADPASGQSESFLGVTMDAKLSQNVASVVNATSQLLKAEIVPAAAALVVGKGSSASGTIDLAKLDATHRAFTITMDEADGAKLVTIYDGQALNKPANIAALATAIQGAVLAIDPAREPYKSFGCSVVTGTILLESGIVGPGSFVRVGNAPTLDVAGPFKLGVSNGGREVDAAALIRPAPGGTTSGDLSTLPAFAADRKIKVTVAGDGPKEILLYKNGTDTAPTSLEELRGLLEARLREVKPTQVGSLIFKSIRVKRVGLSLNVQSDAIGADSVIKFEEAGADTSATALKLTAATGQENLRSYTLGLGKVGGAQSSPVAGEDGSPPDANDYRGSESAKTGIYALLDADLFNILCLPGAMDFASKDDSLAVLSAAVSFCKQHRAFLIVDSPSSWKTFDHAYNRLSDFDSVRSDNAAMYFPRVQMPDPLDGNRLRYFAPCGIIAGLYAKTDAERGVWKAPAGQEAALTGVSALSYKLTDGENGLLNPLGLNSLRMFPVVGPVIWGARTLQGADALASEWKYIPVRRLALFLEESLFRGTQWVVFEPNDEPLWAQIRLNIGAFMQSLFRQGAFQGKTPKEAYFVRCDKETTTQDDINRGIVNIIVGFAPLKPAEFVILKIQQMAGQIQT